MTRWEAFHKVKPNFHNIRMFPIFSMFLVYVKPANVIIGDTIQSSVVDNASMSKLNNNYTSKFKDNNSKSKSDIVDTNLPVIYSTNTS